MTKSTRGQSFTVSFRLDASYLAELEKRAALHSVSIHEEARRIVLDALNDAERGAVREEVSEAKKDIRDLRMRLADAVEALLITAGNYPKDKAREWTTENIREE